MKKAKAAEKQLTKRKKTANKPGSFSGIVKEQFSLFLNSFKHLNAQSSFVVLADLLFYLSVMGLFYAFGAILQKVAPASVQAQAMTAIEGVTNDMNVFLAYFIVGTVILAIASLFLWIISRLLIWKLTLGKSADLNGLWKFSLLAMVFIAISILVLALPLYSFVVYVKQNNLLSIALILLLPLLISVLLYFTNLSFIFFVEQRERNTMDILKRTFKSGFRRIWNFILPLLLMVVMFFIVSLVSRAFELLSRAMTVFMSSLMLLVFLAWCRYYFADVVMYLEEKQGKKQVKVK